MIINESENVYPKKEDSELLLKAAKFAEGRVLDLCTGSGIIALNVAKQAKEVVAVDINPFAIKSARENAKLNRIKNIKFLKSDLFSRLGGMKFDTIYANPPYLPGEEHKNWIDYALNGGSEGSEVTLKIIHGLKNHLKRNGCAFMILSSVYDTGKVYKEIKRLNFSFRRLYSINFFFEELFLIKIYYGKGRNSGKWRKDNSSSNYKQFRSGT